MTMDGGTLIGMVGCFVGLAGWLSGRDKKIVGDATWRGEINAKLDSILKCNDQLQGLISTVGTHETRITVLERSETLKYREG